MEIRRPYTSHKIEIRKSPVHRYGVFAKEDIDKEEILEEVPSIIFPSIAVDAEVEKIEVASRCALGQYVFHWPCSKHFQDEYSIQYRAIPLGYGCLYNHRHENNASWDDSDLCEGAFKFFSNEKIKKGEEIFINYGDMLQIMEEVDDEFFDQFALASKMNASMSTRGPHLSEGGTEAEYFEPPFK
jgi:SET domain-containing protein